LGAMLAIAVSAAVWLGKPALPTNSSIVAELPAANLSSDQGLSVGPVRWAAVAVNSSTGMYGVATGDENQDSADSRAFEFCRGFSEGRVGCRIVLSTAACGAVAVAKGEFFAAEAAKDSAAGILALAQCQSRHGASCALDSTFCASE
jgi:Domain of unknown function (DUF4189)